MIPSTGPTSGQLAIDNFGDYPFAGFSLQVSFIDSNGNFIQAPTGSPTWAALLAGSLDGVAWQTILNHISGTNDNGSIIFSASIGSLQPLGYATLSWSNLSFGNAASIVISVLGVQNVNLKG